MLIFRMKTATGPIGNVNILQLQKLPIMCAKGADIHDVRKALFSLTWVCRATTVPFAYIPVHIFFLQLLKIDKEDNTSLIGRIKHEWRGFLGGISSCCVTDESERLSITCKYNNFNTYL